MLVQPDVDLRLIDALVGLSVNVIVPEPGEHVSAEVVVACGRKDFEVAEIEPKMAGPKAEIALNEVLAAFFLAAGSPPAPPHDTKTKASAAAKSNFNFIIEPPTAF